MVKLELVESKLEICKFWKRSWAGSEHGSCP